ncbi:MAG: hypothetical protein ACIAS6_05630 [Phycisphaerales bacterium JB060]
MPHAHPAEAARLLDFLRERDAPCPVCGYNLRNLTTPVCPECRHDLVLTVGLARPRFGWLLVAMAPGMFSGVAGLLVCALIVLVLVTEGDLAPWPVFLLAAFGLASGAAAIAMGARRHRLMALGHHAQFKLAAIAWSVHVLAFLVAVIWASW